MPEMVIIEVNPSYKPTGATALEKADAEQAWAEALRKQNGTDLKGIEVAFQTGVEAVENSRGLYRIRQTSGAVPDSGQRIEDKPNNELKAMALSLGVKLDGQKRIKRTELIRAIQAKLDAVEVVDDTEPDETEQMLQSAAAIAAKAAEEEARLEAEIEKRVAARIAAQALTTEGEEPTATQRAEVRKEPPKKT